MDSKILFKNETTYTPEIAMEAGDAFWKIQPAYRKRAKRFKLGAGILAVTFALLAILVARENGFGIVSVGALVMAAIALVGFIKGEQLVKGSAKNLQAMNTRVNYGISENFFFVLNREYLRKQKNDGQAALEGPDLKNPDEEIPALPQGEDFAEPEEPSDENEEPETEDDEEEYSDNEYADEFLSLEDLLVCVVTENLYILIWEKPYYILDRHGFEDEKDGEFRQFIEEKARIIEA